MTPVPYRWAIGMIFAAFAAFLLILANDTRPDPVRLPEPMVIVTTAPGWVSVNGEAPVPECAEGDDCTGPDYR